MSVPTCPECGGPRRSNNRHCSRACYWTARRRLKPPCSVEGCNDETEGRGLCNKHAIRRRRTGTTSSPMDRTIPDRFWDKVETGGPDECWPWIGGDRRLGGYGLFTIENTPRVRIGAHRFAYMLATGTDVRGYEVMHACDNPPCVNPSHLSHGTHADNMADAHAKGRLYLGGLELSPTRLGRRA